MKKRVLIVGAGGTLGKAIVAELSPDYEIVTANRSSGDVQIDITDAASIIAGIAKAGPLDAVVCAAGSVAFAPLDDFKAAPFGESLHTKGMLDKLLGQINLALAARDALREGCGSITLITGVLADQFIKKGASASMVNNAVEGFARAAAFELPANIRINVVSPNVFEESMDKYASYFPGFTPVPVAKAARAFRDSIEKGETGQVYKIH